jgi:protein-S-isoprenylcysteine O-methyltransferase Ste14
MHSELLFRLLLIVNWVIFGGVRIYYRRKHPISKSNGDKPEPAKQRTTGIAVILLSIGILGMLISVILFLVIPFSIPWFQLSFPALIRWVGVILGFSIVPFLVWIHRTLGRSYSAALQIRDKHILVRSGPYSRVRHPMYTVFIFFIISMVLIAANLLVSFFGIFVILMFLPVSKIEEQMMIDEFGEEYRSYMKQTGRFFPRLRRQTKKDTSSPPELDTEND